MATVNDDDMQELPADDIEPAVDREFVSVESGWAPPESTGVDAVDSAVAGLIDIDAVPTAEHVARYEVVHRQLQDALADLDGS